MAKRGIVRNVAFTKVLHDGKLCFYFCGLHDGSIREVFDKMHHLYDGCLIESGTRHIVSGKYYKSVAVTITQPHFEVLSEAEWPVMITHLLQTSIPCAVTYFDNFHEFMNT